MSTSSCFILTCQTVTGVEITEIMYLELFTFAGKRCQCYAYMQDKGTKIALCVESGLGRI